jgi:hypothetical protein
MLCPLVKARMVERNDLTGFGIQAGQIRTFMKIASMARESEVPWIIGTAMLFRDYVLNVVREIAMLLAEQAILASIPRPSSDEVSRGRLHR